MGAATDNLANVLAATASRFGERTALLVDGRSVSWTELDAQVDAVARGLRALGVEAGDRVMLALGTSEAFVQSYLGTLRAGGVAAPLNPTSTATEVEQVIRSCAPRVVVVEEESLQAAGTALSHVEQSEVAVPRLVVAAAEVPDADSPGGQVSLPSLIAEHAEGETPGPAPGSGEDLAVLLFTSGTSSDPRAAMLSHRALAANLDQLLRLEPPVLDEDDVVLGVLPMFHVYGLNAMLGLAVQAGSTLALARRFDPEGTLDLVQQAGVTMAPVAPPILVAWAGLDDLAGRLSGVRTVLSGAAALPVAIIRALEDQVGLTVHQGYGLTEAAPVVTTTLASPFAKPGSIGRPLPDVEVRLVDETGEEVEEDDPGELEIRGPNLFSGYWPGAAGGPDDEGWWRTGDVAYADADGDLYLVDRIKDLVIVNGFNVYPSEVEQAIAGLPGVAEVAVVPVPHPATGEAVKAVVVPEEGVSITPEDVMAHCEGMLARFKRPTIVDVVSALPRTATGKVAKGTLRRASAAVPGVR